MPNATELIRETVHDAFQALYPKANVIVHGAGEETVTVCVQHGTDYLQGFTCEIPSDDDGYFYFYNDTNRIAIVMIAYPDLEDAA